MYSATAESAQPGILFPIAMSDTRTLSVLTGHAGDRTVGFAVTGYDVNRHDMYSTYVGANIK